MSTFEKALVAHLVADWIFQNEWMALNKVRWEHPAAWVHSGIHCLALLFVFPAWLAILVAVTHYFIDLRVALQWWRKVFGQTTEGPMAVHVAIWSDQAVHIVCLALAVACCG